MKIRGIHRFLMIIAAGLLLAAKLLHAEVRNWTSADGRTLQAELVGIVGVDPNASAKLKLSNGSFVEYPIAKLSEEDRVFIKGSSAPKSAPQTVDFKSWRAQSLPDRIPSEEHFKAVKKSIEEARKQRIDAVYSEIEKESVAIQDRCKQEEEKLIGKLSKKDREFYDTRGRTGDPDPSDRFMRFQLEILELSSRKKGEIEEVRKSYREHLDRAENIYQEEVAKLDSLYRSSAR